MKFRPAAQDLSVVEAREPGIAMCFFAMGLGR